MATVNKQKGRNKSRGLKAIKAKPSTKARKKSKKEENKEMSASYKWQLLETGLDYGYPICCILEFINNIATGTEVTHDKNQAGNATGFVPCSKHAALILENKITLQSLISERKFEFPFPIDHQCLEDRTGLHKLEKYKAMFADGAFELVQETITNYQALHRKASDNWIVLSSGSYEPVKRRKRA